MVKKCFIILLLILLFSTITVLATDIDMDLPTETENNSEDANLVDGNATTDSNEVQNIQDTLDTLTPQDDIGGDATPSSVTSIAQENMSFSNILNILIITVGVILILLAIAILIRLKS